MARRAWGSVVAALLLWGFFEATKHSALFAPFAPFTSDPYDVVGSFSFQIAIAVALLNVVRLGLIVRQRRPERLPYVGRGVTVVAGCIAVTMVSDTIAVVRAGLHPPRAPAEAGLWVAIAGLLLVAAVLPARVPALPGSLPPANVGGEFDWIFRRPVFRAIDPQRHAVRFALTVALSAAFLTTAAEVIGDGPAPTFQLTLYVILLRVAIEASGVVAGVLVLGRYLGVI